MIVHWLRGGFAVCGFSKVLPRDWPDGHRWISEELARLTCTGCVAVRNAREPGPGDVWMQNGQRYEVDHVDADRVVHLTPVPAEYLARADDMRDGRGGWLRVSPLDLEALEKNG